jgi:hypothetical protein
VGVLDADSNTGDGKENNDPAAAIGGVPFPANEPGPFEAVDNAGDGAAGEIGTGGELTRCQGPVEGE